MGNLEVKIELNYDVGTYSADGLPEHTVSFKVEDMNDETIHSWFELFDRVLKCAGWNDEAIARGACVLAFNETRSMELMKKVAHESDLRLNEEFHAEPVRKHNLNDVPLHDA